MALDSESLGLRLCRAQRQRSAVLRWRAAAPSQSLFFHEKAQIESGGEYAGEVMRPRPLQRTGLFRTSGGRPQQGNVLVPLYW